MPESFRRGLGTRGQRTPHPMYGKEGERPAIEITFKSVGRPMAVEAAAYTPFLLNIGAFGVAEQGLQRRAQFYEGTWR